MNYDILNYLQDEIYISDDEFNIIFMNNAMVKLIGSNKDKIKCYEAIYGNNSKCEWCEHEKNMTIDKYISYDFKLLESDQYRNVTSIWIDKTLK